MNDSIILKLVLMIVTLSVIFGSIVYRGLRKDPIKELEHQFADGLNYWLQEQISIQLSVSLDHLDKKAKNRIAGAALKAVRPLRQVHTVQIQLPNIVQTSSGEWKHFTKNVSLEDVRHLIPGQQ